ncbi:hypothetical protein DFQ01_11089 [Paenibacillus cellulosilyticus]|uniref:Uncharacterized protein n=1 Tax=Paenibacillus cellulosilyticus TaxID=375489 RepID=A0A2V2YSR3_9BACL|nr:hypothetical protein [Paenibacillus cellulosilyticus]PWW01199.1 hypothetical protein DFQ01_11089 [Paenibacillus cellulosilyticus]QKS46846.1 hypothetical protein HUB94_20395 [Paenibacillus cellulosilyticus]
MNMATFYHMALRMKTDPKAFIAASEQAYDLILQGKTPADDASWFAWGTDRLPQWQPIPDPPEEFCLVSFLHPYMESQPFVRAV